MSTVYEKDGRRCDSRCYNGFPWTTCTCVCEGKNHSEGKEKAERNSKEIKDEESAKGCDAPVEGEKK